MAKILIVEDDNHLREIYELRLQAAGHTIVSAADGEEALKVAIKEKPELIISDVMMPKISGFDMLDILRTTDETKNTKIIMMTALSQAEDKQRAESLGADRYLVKSQVTLDDVAQVTEEVLSGKETPKEPTPPPESTLKSAEIPESQITPQPNDSNSTTPATESTATDDNKVESNDSTNPTEGKANSTKSPSVPGLPIQPQQTSTSAQNDQPTNDNATTTKDVKATGSDNTDNTQSNQTKDQTNDSTQPSTAHPSSTSASDDSQSSTQSQTTVEPQSIDAEQEAIAQQIESFIHTKVDDINQTKQHPEHNDNDSNKEAGLHEQELSEGQNDENPPSKRKRVIQPINSDLNTSKADELNKLVEKEAEKEEISKIVDNIRSENTTEDQATMQKAHEENLNSTETTQQPQPQPLKPDVDIGNDGALVSNSVGTPAQQIDSEETTSQVQSTTSEEAQTTTTATQQNPQSRQDAEQIPQTTTADSSLEQKASSQPSLETPQNQTTQEQPQEQPQGDQQTPQKPVIPHTKGVAIDGMVPPKQAPTNPNDIAL